MRKIIQKLAIMSRYTQVKQFSLTPVSHPIDFNNNIKYEHSDLPGLYSDLIGTGLDRIGLESNWIWQEADVI